jgi:2,3-diaminopropionate biosynthesis protein SbnB
MLDSTVTTQSSNSSMLYLSQADLVSLGANHSTPYVQAIKDGLIQHASGKFVQPLKPYLRWDGANHIADRIIAMPCYLGGDNPAAGIKWIGSRQHNPSKYNKPRASALLVLNDTDTNYPMAILEGSLISGMRTAAISVVASEYLAKENFTDVACIGGGPIAQMQLISMLQQFSSIKNIHLFDLNNEAARLLAIDIKSQFNVEILIKDTAEQAVREGDVVLTCTTTSKPYLEFSWLKEGCFLCNISIMDVHKEVFLKADKVIVDDWDQCNREKKIINQLVLDGTFSREKLHAELGEIVSGKIKGRSNDKEIILLNPMGMAIDDLICAQYFYNKAREKSIGTTLPL